MAQHLSFPIQVGTRGLVSVGHNSDADIAQSVTLLLNTRPGDRRAAPDYGLPDPVFGGVDASEITSVVTEWEPRADLTNIDIELMSGAEVALLIEYLNGTFSAAPKLGIDFGSTYRFTTQLAVDLHDGTYRIGD